MTKDELIAALVKLHGKGVDIEAAHGDADWLLIEYINDPDIEAAYCAVEK